MIGTSDMKKLNKDSAEMTELLNGLCESVKAQFFDLLSVFNLYFFCTTFPIFVYPFIYYLPQSTRFGLTVLVDHRKVDRATRKKYSSCLILRRRKYEKHSAFNTEKSSNALVTVKNKRTFNNISSNDFDESLMNQYLISKPERKKKVCSLKDLVEFMKQILKCIYDRSSHPKLFCQKRVLNNLANQASGLQLY